MLYYYMEHDLNDLERRVKELVMYNCRDYTIDELSMVIYNDEDLYYKRHTLTEKDLESLGYRFTQDQWETFQRDLKEEI